MSNLPKYLGTSNKIIKSMVVEIQHNLQKSAKPGAARIKREYDNGVYQVKLQQTDSKRFSLKVHGPKGTGALIWLVDNKIEIITITDANGTHVSEQCVGRVTPFIEVTKHLMYNATSEGILRQKAEMVRNWLQLTSKGDSGRVSREIKHGKDTYRVWCTPGGQIMLVNCSSGVDIFLKVTKTYVSATYMEWSKKHGCWMDYAPGAAERKIINLLDKLFPSASEEKGIRV